MEDRQEEDGGRCRWLDREEEKVEDSGKRVAGGERALPVRWRKRILLDIGWAAGEEL
jgi:hypothetical protein